MSMRASLNDGLRSIAGAITPLGAMPGRDESGGHIASLTEAVMGVTAGLYAIANALWDVAEAIREGKSP